MLSINASSKKTKSYSNMIIKALDITSAQYLKRLFELSKTQHLETTMTTKDNSNIQYEHIYSQAHRKHAQTFFHNCEETNVNILKAFRRAKKR